MLKTYCLHLVREVIRNAICEMMVRLKQWLSIKCYSTRTVASCMTRYIYFFPQHDSNQLFLATCPYMLLISQTLSHRIGLIPIRFDPNLLSERPETKEATTTQNTLVLRKTTCFTLCLHVQNSRHEGIRTRRKKRCDR